MSSLTFFFICVQACLLQNVYSQCIGAGWPALAPGYGVPGLGPRGYGLAEPAVASWGYGIAEPAVASWGYGLAEPAVASWGCGQGLVKAYGGEGVGDVAVGGEMPAAGATVVAGQVPVLGGVEFAGMLPAVGAITIAGSCSCGCPGYAGAYYY